MARRTALALLDENALEKLVDLLPREDKEPTTELKVGEMVSRFLEDMTTIPGQGVCFPDEGWYPRKKENDGNNVTGVIEDEEEEGRHGFDAGGKGGRMRRNLHNRILSNVVKKIGGKVMEDTGRVGAWVVKVLAACPEIVAG
jgi:nucleolar pre-ribosomal-associated protein 1